MQNKLYDAVMGLVVGDALGVPAEFKSREELKKNPVTDMMAYGTYNQPKGTWSDDSGMMLATLESIKRCGKIDIRDIMNNFCKWYYEGKFTPYGETFGVGLTTCKAIKNYKSGKPLNECGCSGYLDNGNGSLMRILPLAFIEHTKDDIKNVSSLTHSHEISVMACEIYLSAAELLIKGNDFSYALERTISKLEVPQKFRRLDGIEKLPESEINSTGFVIDTIEAACYCILNTDNYRECVLKAVNLGDDTDTTAAVAGGLAGIIYGTGTENGIPESWIKSIAKKEYIENLCK